MTDTSAVVNYENLQFHELANIFPLIEGEEFDAFVDAFKRQGLLNPITLYQGKIVDGRNRYRAGKKVGYKFSAKDFTNLTREDPKDFVIAANVQRRHLTTELKRDLILQRLRERRPGDSDRKIALFLGVSNKTVSAYHKDMDEVFEKFVTAWRGLDAAQQKEFVIMHRHELQQAGTV